MRNSFNSMSEKKHQNLVALYFFKKLNQNLSIFA